MAELEESKAERKQARAGGRAKPKRKQAKADPQARAERKQAKAERRQRVRSDAPVVAAPGPAARDAESFEARMEERLAGIEGTVANLYEQCQDLFNRIDELLHEAAQARTPASPRPPEGPGE